MKTTFGFDAVWAIAGNAANIATETTAAATFRNVLNPNII
jgi:hypothetical protein